ncbi:MAG: cytochrome d ubiquinol oxidase subunit II, partial [Planctomycetota bacterium]|nr:cytochrome d ubiquinol oxidase subunit II [Planctomycetota bacterium]
MTLTLLQVAWFAVIALFLAAYAALDGFDLGAGMWHLFARDEKDRRIILRAIGPYWDGNEVWLLGGGGAVFAAFPAAYAALFGTVYLPVMALILALILRAAAVEFRGKFGSAAWRLAWDIAFAAGSFLVAFLLGVVSGALLEGVPLRADQAAPIHPLAILTPYSALFGLMAVFGLAGHGALFLAMKAGGEVSGRARRWASAAWSAWAVTAGAAAIATARADAPVAARFSSLPAAVLPVLTVAAAFLAGWYNGRRREEAAFACSAAAVCGAVLSVAVALFPRLVPARGRPDLDLTIFNASSSPGTLLAMLVIAATGMPFVIGYTIWMYPVSYTHL